jgi:hypothetical protein
MAGFTLTSDDYDGTALSSLPHSALKLPSSDGELVRRLKEDAFDYPFPPRWMVDDLNPMAGQPFRGATGTTNDRKGGRDLPLYWSEVDLRGFRVLSRWLCETNDFAIGFLGLLGDYNIGNGFGWQACLHGVKKGTYQTTGSEANPVVAKGQRILDAWRDSGRIPWPMRSYEAFQRWCRDGEVGIRFFYGGWNRLPEARFVGPEQIGSPDGNTDGPTSFGIERDPKDVETHWAYHLWDMDSGMAHGEWVDADRIIFATKNVDTDVVRGLSDFFPVHESLDGVRRLLRTMLLTSIRQSAIAWREKFGTATGEQVAASVPERATGRGYGVPASNAPANWPYWMGDPKQWGFNRFDPASVLKVEGNRTFEDGPTAGSVPNFTQAAQASLRGAGVRWRFPEYFSGDASNNNMASSLVAGSPFTVATTCQQTKWGALIERRVALKVLDEATEAGLLTREERRQLDVEVTAPAVVTPQPDKDTETYCKQIDKGIVCLDTVRQKLGYDPQHEAEGVKKDQAAKAVQQPAPTPGNPNPTPGQDATGGSEVSQAFGESVDSLLTEAIASIGLLCEHGITTVITDKNGHKHKYVDGKPVAMGKDETGEKKPGSGDKAPLSDADKKLIAPQVLPGLDAKILEADPEAAKKPGVLAWAHEKAVGAMAKVGLFLLKNQEVLSKVGGIMGAVLDTPADMQKFGYNPSVSSGGHASSIVDPVQMHLGISTHLAATIATHVLSAGLTWFKKKLAGKTSESAVDVAGVLAELFGILADEFGLAKPSMEAIKHAIGS